MKTLGIIAIGLCISLCGVAMAEEWYVDGSVSESGNGQSWETAFKKIQEGMNAASSGDTVIVGEGTYVENIQFKGKNIVLRSTDPMNPDVVSRTIIDGNESGSVVTFAGTEDETCVLSGFTVRKGNSSSGGGIWGGKWDTHTGATIESNRIVDNYAEYYGGGLAYCGGTVRNNVISDNGSEQGSGGLFVCNGTVENNVISGNSGAGLTGCDGIIQGNIVCKNSEGGLHSCKGTIRNNVVYANTAGWLGGGLSYCSGTIESNTIVGNSAKSDGGALYYCRGTIVNCIIWGNEGGSQVSECSVPAFSCIQNWNEGGTGNVAFYPYLVDPENEDFHLLPWSPCIDAGDPSWPFSEEPEPHGGRVNMGAYGNTGEAACKSPDTDSDDLPDEWETHWFTDLAEEAESDPDGDGIANIIEYRFGWHPTVAGERLVENLTKGQGYGTIQAALYEASDGDQILVHAGTYEENIVFGGKNVVLGSTDPLDAIVVSTTIIDGMGNDPVVTFAGTEDETCVLSGLTLRNGKGKIQGGTWDCRTRATIENNVITNNLDGGLVYCDGTIRNNIIIGNEASGSEYEQSSGGALYKCDGTIQGNVMAGNSAKHCGGALAYCNGAIRNNLIVDNWARRGGGLYGCQGTIQNNTIMRNAAQEDGGGLAECDGRIQDCIVWGNTASHWSQLSESRAPTYSCVQYWTGAGEGNIPFDPHFVDSENDDFHLQPRSPCIDRADPTSPFSNEPEPNGGRVNMGAYGNTAEAATKSPDTDSDGLPDAWELHWFADLRYGADSDPDEDRIPNVTEYLYAWDPTSAAETRVKNLTRDAWYPTMQAALSDSHEGDQIVVYPGVYIENIVFGGSNVVLRSTNPLDEDVVASTIIDGNKAGCVITFSGMEDESCILSGFTIRNGKADSGGGIHGGTWGNSTHATIQGNVISDNSASSAGGGLYQCDGNIRGNVITNNLANVHGGGGLFGCDGIIENNMISENSVSNVAAGDGGSRGGGLAYCYGTIRQNTITGNYAGYGGGLGYCHGEIENNVIANNSAGWGGGLYECGALIENNTIAENSAAAAGGIGYCFECIEHYDAVVRNCIIWDNVAQFDYQLSEGTEVTYSCIQDWTGGGEGNIAEAPLFLDPDGADNNPDTHDDNNYRLSLDSPCIDAGQNDDWMWDAVDLDANPRIVDGDADDLAIVDMGAYEYRFVFRITELIKPLGAGLELKWNSRPQHTYTVWSCSDLLTGSWNKQARIPSDGQSTTWTDFDATARRRFYRIQIE